jgi:DNA-binding IclR family transcriptional regulator
MDPPVTPRQRPRAAARRTARPHAQAASAAPRRDSEYSGPKSPLRVMQIVELLAQSRGGLPLGVMTERLAIPKTSLLNHLRVMAGAGYLGLHEGRYTLGPAAMRLGVIIAAEADVLAAARPVAAELVARTGETVLVATLDEASQQVLYTGITEGSEDMRYAPLIGTRRPLYCTGLGRALLAYQDEAYIERYLSGSAIVRRTPHTVTDPARLRRLLAKVRSEGFAIALGEHTAGAGAVAAAIVERDGRVRHAIGLGVPVARLEPRREQLAALVREAAAQVAWALGAREPAPVRPQ